MLLGKMKFSKKTWMLLVGIVAALAFASVAVALTTFNPSTGTGFVGKGDVQTPWSWNNNTLQNHAGSVSFNYQEINDTAYYVTCEWDTGTIHVVHHTQTTNHALSDTVAYDVSSATRNNPRGNVTGFNLNGPIGDPVVTDGGDPIPVVGDTCPGNSGLGLVTGVEADPTDSSSSQTLYASSSFGPQGPTAIWINGVSVHA